jgi:hypothetical protein
MGPMTQLHATEIMQGIRQRNLEYQRLQELLRLQKQAGDQATSIFGGGDTGMLGGNAGPIPAIGASATGTQPSAGMGTSAPVSSQDVSGGTQASTGIGTGDTGQDQSSPSPDGTTPPIAASSQKIQSAATQAGMTPAAYRQKLAAYYIPLMQLQAINGNTEALQRTRDEAVAMLGENLGGRSLAEAFHFHQIYNDLKGPAANNYASQLENHVAQGNALTSSQALFMRAWTGANAPATYIDLPSGERRLQRGGVPVTSAMLTELQRHGVAPAGFGTGAGQPGTAPAPGQPAPQQQPPTGTVGPHPLYYDQQQAKATAEDPLYQNALAQATTANQILTALSRGDRLSQLGALGAVTRMTMPTARTNPEMSQAQLEDLTSKWFQKKEEYEKWFKSNLPIPFDLQQQIGNLAIAQSEAARAAYENRYQPLREAYEKQTGGNSSIAMPEVPRPNPDWMVPGRDYGQRRGAATVPEGAQPAPPSSPAFQGRTATNPKTGQRMREVAPNDWEPY